MSIYYMYSGVEHLTSNLRNYHARKRKGTCAKIIYSLVSKVFEGF